METRLKTSKVSVYMPTAGKCDLRPAVLSVLEQDYTDFEFIVVNDSGADREVLGIDDLRARDSRLKIVDNARSKGACGARNTAISIADGYFVTGIDDDDLMLPGRISAMVEAWDDSCSLVYCGHIRRFADRDQVVAIPAQRISPERILHRNIIGNQVLTKLSYMQNVGLFDETLPAYQDFDMWVRLTRHYGYAKGVDHNNYVFIQTGDDRISASRARRRSAWLKFVEKHRPWLSVSQRQSLSLLVYKEQWKKPTVRTLVAFANCTNWRLVALFVRRRIFGH